MSFGAESIILKQDKVVKIMKENNAVSPKSAKDLKSLNIKQTRTFNNLMKQNVIKQIGNKYYLDIYNWKIFKKSFKRWILI
ncbi:MULTISPECIES: hypothetical protein [Mammaliicoccus]|uniref:Uncharacterized protein n=1 Tax=Mammaliicoccus sciuri TaxID=1296 RepID=A0AAW5LHD7_MAMSC|nr:MULTISPECIES: hypothetical protein [Mammaliicoccus]MBG9211161.1 hypothetical protein [Mammaliicoccus sciuri]MCD5142395.1 hypothetical protein [Mammaliicoccus sciuri]MCQ9304680.1 hypothetical protein [Mammaliicoccus sciuri]MDT0745963.1 hypothetical protein [Mammaliicoccus sciuri]MDT0753318.1 hypothetical protein [Mammaliicoccus sciuri]